MIPAGTSSSADRVCIHCPEFENLTHRGASIHPKKKQDIVCDVHSDMMSLPSKGLFLIEFFDENIRTFEAKHPYF